MLPKDVATKYDTDTVNVRVFLAAYMIACSPSHVFESMGTLEKDLLDSAVLLLGLFEQILSGIQQHCTFYLLPADTVARFQPALFDYLRRFKAWKVPDEAKLTCCIQHCDRWQGHIMTWHSFT
jgi:hypothetical protein